MTETAVKHCLLCRDPFKIGTEHDYGDVLEHWAHEHDDSEIFWNVLDAYRTHTRCGNCGEFFAAEIGASQRGLVVDMYCPDCCDGELDNSVKALIVDDVTGRYVLQNSEEIERSDETDEPDRITQLFDLFDQADSSGNSERRQ